MTGVQTCALPILRLPYIQAAAKGHPKLPWIPFQTVSAVPWEAQASFDGTHYGEAWAFLHYLLHKAPEGKACFRKFRDLALRGRFGPQEFAKAFGKTPEQFDPIVKEYVLSLKPDEARSHVGMLRPELLRIQEAIRVLDAAPTDGAPYLAVCGTPPVPGEGYGSRWKEAAEVIEQYLAVLEKETFIPYHARRLYRLAEARCRKVQASNGFPEMDLPSERAWERVLLRLRLLQRCVAIMEQATYWSLPAPLTQTVFVETRKALRSELAAAKAALDTDLSSAGRMGTP